MFSPIFAHNLTRLQSSRLAGFQDPRRGIGWGSANSQNLMIPLIPWEQGFTVAAPALFAEWVIDNIAHCPTVGN